MKFIQKNKGLILIFILSLLIRLFSLGSFPIGFHADEVRVGWNAYSILKTGKDDRGNSLALYYNTFGDYRPTGIFYLTLPSIFLFGPSQFAVRFPTAALGAATIVPLFLLTKEITKSKRAGYLASFFLALTPWHWIVSRATSEAILSLFFGLYGVVFYIEGLNKRQNKFLVFSVISFVVSCLLYHSARPMAPLIMIITLVSYWKKIKPEIKKIAVSTCIFISIFTAVLLLGKGSLSRFHQVSINTNIQGVQASQPLVTKIRDQYLDYLSFNFLIGDTPKPFRYRVFGVSILGSALTVLLIIGIIYAIQKKSSRLPLLLLLLSPIPASVTYEDSPNLHRALFMLPFILIIAATGATKLFNNSYKGKYLSSLLILVFLVTSTTSIISYFSEGAKDAAPYRNYGAVELVSKINALQDKYDHVILTNKPDSPYPWYAFLNKLDPKEFNSHAILRTQPAWDYKKITFTTNSCPAAIAFDKKSEIKGKILVADGLNCEKDSILRGTLGAKVVSEISVPDGTVVYRLWEKEN